MSTTHIKPTLGRIVWYRGDDGEFRAAIITGVNSDFNVNLNVFGHHAIDVQCGPKDSVTHADPEQEPLCFPSWGWMPYQVEQAKKQADTVAAGVQPKTSSTDTSDAAIEQEIQAKGKTAPRVTPADIEGNIRHEVYFVASEAVDVTAVLANPALELLTFCVITLQNGFTVTGESACASPESFDAEIGRKVARQNAVQKIWPLMGYALKQQLHDEACEYALLHGEVAEQ